MLPIATDCYPWINRDLIESALKSSKSATANLVDYQLHDAVGKGENYCSQLIRIFANYCDGNGRDPKSTSFVIKTTLNKQIHDMLEKASTFGREIEFYRDILPKFAEYTKIIDAEYKCSPRCFLIGEDPTYLLFEDLREQNYRNMDRRIGLNFKACEIVLKKLAKFHTIGTMIYEQNPEIFVRHREKLFTPDTKELMMVFASGIRNVQEACTKWTGYEHYSVKLATLYDILFARASDAYTYDPNIFNTLMHGDLWMNNIMYRFNDADNPVDVLMIDYQVGYYGSPAIDLSYLLFTSSTNELYEEDWDRLIQIYHAELVKSLKAVYYTKSIPTLTELHIEFLKRAMYSVMISLAIVGPRHMINAEKADMDSIINDPEGYKKAIDEVYQQPPVIERLKYLLDYFDRKGFLDC